MPPTAFSWLHLTDFHYGLRGQKSLWPNLRQPFLDDLEALHKLTGPWQAVLFTGDMAQQGKSEEFREFQAEVLGRLWEKLEELDSGEAKLLAVPGNHDLFRPIRGTGAVDMLSMPQMFGAIADTFWNENKPDNEYRRVIHNAFAAYAEWWKDNPHRPKDCAPGLLPGDFAYSLEHDGLRIGIVGLNTAFLQLQGGDYLGKLVWDARQLQQVCGGAMDDWQGKHDFCLLLTHHGMDWLTPEAREHGRLEIANAGRFAVHLHGHMHENAGATTFTNGNPKAYRYFQGCSVFGMELFGEPPKLQRSHGYVAGKIEINEQGHVSLRFWPRKATKESGEWCFVPDYVRFPYLLDDHGTPPEVLGYRKSRSPDAAGEVRGSGATKAPYSASAPRAATHSTLPPRRPFFGRKEELETVASHLQPESRGWGAVLDGPGGIGKTALAVEAAYRAPAEHYPLKVFVTAKGQRLDPDGPHRLQDNRCDDFHALLTGIGLGLGRDDIRKTSREQQPEFIRHALAAQRALLVLDNLESLNKAERRRVYDLLEMLPAPCKAIVTTRRRDETAARTLRLDRLDYEASCELLASLGELWPPVARLTEDEKQRLYAETGGNPLLLTWTAGQLDRAQSRCRTVEQAVARLKEAHERHARNEANDPLEFIFGDLLDTFNPDETAVLAALAYFTEPAKLAWLLPLAGLGSTAALTALDDLRNRALLIEDEAEETWLLPPLAAHFLKQRRPEAVGAAGRRLEEQAYALAMQYGGARDKAPFTELEKHWPTLAAAMPLLLAGDNARLQAVCDALDFFLDFSGRWEFLLNLHREAEARALAAGDDYNAGWRAYQAGWVHYALGEAEAVLDCAERCARHWRQAQAGAHEQATAIRLRGLGHELRKDYPAAISASEQVLALWRSLDPESQEVAIALNGLAVVKRESGDLIAAEADYREALRLARRIGNREGIAVHTGNLAELALDRQDWSAAERLATEALELAKGVGRVEMIAFNHRTLAEALRRQQRAAEALPHAQEAVAIFTRLRHRALAEAEATLAACLAALAGPG